MYWPERPHCHQVSSAFNVGHDVAWRDPRPDELWRTCSYCGSVHPEDLLKAIEQGATLGGADWKYGWPHKFYVQVPNPIAGQQQPQFGYGGKLEDWRGRYPESSATDEPGKFLLHYYPAPATRQIKWYNEHLEDLDDEAFAVLAETLKQKTHIAFARVDGKLKYSAPRPGYQVG